ncbi:heat-shock protein 80 [Artemisia annua]|uniref:Heat-shock protein 80 n=1 Tax=Artemisia annua TaxID=35608 RepID=A0A2U1MWY5_ARTAN|nr:heat-shock protein 80 [Artemisia annua]
MSTSTLFQRIRAKPIPFVTKTHFDEVMENIRADMESRFTAQRQSDSQAGPSSSRRILPLERLSELMLDKFLNDSALLQAHPNIYNGLVEPEAPPPSPTQADNQIKNLEKMMLKQNSETIKLVQRLSSRDVELESQCRPQSRRRDQDDRREAPNDQEHLPPLPSQHKNKVMRIYDSVIYKSKSDRDYNTRLVNQEISKALGVSTPTTLESNITGKKRRKRSPLWKKIPRVPRSDTVPLVPYINDDLKYMLKGPKEYQPSTKEVATYEGIPEPFLEEERFLDIFSEEEIDCEKYNIDPYLGIINVNERSRGYYRLKHLRSKPRDKVYSRHRILRYVEVILRYVEVNSQYQHSHGYVEYHVESKLEEGEINMMDEDEVQPDEERMTTREWSKLDESEDEKKNKEALKEKFEGLCKMIKGVLDDKVEKTSLLTSGFSLDDPNTFGYRIHKMLKLSLSIDKDAGDGDIELPAWDEADVDAESKMEEVN